mmetsp:Transcript_27364/g.77027  ORF Transcript_27364/g.77027 Transcript_27364/m.77027 type:complete len:900 (+) Transcript_27364:70-2769(+)
MFAEEVHASLQEAALGKLGQDALRIYGKRLDEAREAGKGEFPCFSRRSCSLRNPAVDDTILKRDAGVLRVEIARDMAQQDRTAAGAPREGRATMVLDGETVLLCQCCRLPVGELAYASGESNEELMHGECKAQCMLREMQADERERKRENQDLKQARREEFDIGWQAAETIPQNAVSARKLGSAVQPQGMACLAIEGDSVRVAATLEPAAAVNLEYLSIALQVRRTEGKEPLFSLDPIDNGKAAADTEEASMQFKRFEPEWLAGTSVGEVMFQADYHLKELSFGEYDQPVVGMKSCFEHSELDGEDSEWSAREWFVVRKAEMHISGDQVLIPYLKMGVEAREQVVGDDGLEDAAITRPDHPLVMYADVFTHNFDLIAERKSVVSQLREVAKASILAKYLIESGTVLGAPWFSVGMEGSKGGVCCLEVPQLWNDRCFSKISLKDGALKTDSAPKMHGLYGGVDFGIDRFRLSAPSRVATSVVAGRAVLGRPASTLMATSRTGLSVGPARQFARLSAPLSATMSMAASRAGLGVPRVAAGLSMGVPQGVDLNLDKFNLSAASEQCGHWGSSVLLVNDQLVVGGAFWSKLDEASAFGAEDSALLKDIFNPHLSDRRQEGALFMPPPTSLSHMQRLRNLVKGEQMVRQQRQDHFCSADFKRDEPGPLFPSSWTASFGIHRDVSDEKVKSSALCARPDYMAEASVLQEVLKSSGPVFDKRTEDGMTYRVYRFGSVEVRTTQECTGDEVIAMVFAAFKNKSVVCDSIKNSEKIVKATEYVEISLERSSPCTLYVVFETDAGNTLSAENFSPKWAENQWTENQSDLQDRNSLAKVIRTCDDPVGITVGELKAFAAECIGHTSRTGYVQSVYCFAIGDTRSAISGFRSLRQPRTMSADHYGAKRYAS